MNGVKVVSKALSPASCAPAQGDGQRKKRMISYNRMKELIYYRSGELYWIKNHNLAGSIDNKGYKRISLDKKRYKVHRIVWYYHHQIWPINQIDHIDGNKLNNRIENLRDVSSSINMYNKQKAYKNNTTGFLGVTKSGTKFVARLRVGNKLIHLGTHPTKEIAHEVYKNKKSEIINAFSSS